LASPELLRRFEQESQALGRLQHPGIAQIYEAGAADSGFGPQPYFAMECIRGQSLLQYAEARHLTTRQRLELMSKVCEAVHHAHQRGIIHRDLKPGNILVDESGQPKILDFGVARLTGVDAHATRQTDVGHLVGTLAYMSPEQALADPLELDTRSDVYALGVILFELLAGRLPYNVSRQLHEAVRTIREEEPAPLSSVSRTYRGDIETIAAKALEKDKARRYSSAAELAADIQRYLNDDPIVARRPSAVYQLQKFARRHKPLVAGVAAVFMVLIAGIITTTWEATRARRAERAALRERDRADSQSATAKAINDFLQNDLLAQASATAQARPGTKPDPDIKVRTALDRAAARITGRFDKQPLVEASIRQTIGDTYKDLGLYPDAERQMDRVLELRRRVLGEEHPDTLSSMNSMALLYLYEGKYALAEPVFAKVVDLQRRVLGEGHPDTLTSMSNLTLLYRFQGKYAQAQPLVTKVLEGRLRVLGQEHPDTLTTMDNLAVLFRAKGDYAQAETLLTKVVEVRRRVLGEDHPDTLTSMNDLAALYQTQGKYAQAEPLFAAVMEAWSRTLGEEHPYTLVGIHNLAVVYGSQSKFGQAGRLFTKVMEIQRRVLGDEHPNQLRTMNSLARLYLNQGKYAQAEQLYIKVLEVRRRVLGPENPATANVLASLGQVRLKQQRYSQAESLLRQALKSQEKSAPDSWERYDTQSMLGSSLAAQAKYGQAEPLVMAGYQGLLERKAKIPWERRSALEQAGERIVQLYKDWGNRRRRPNGEKSWPFSR
jgi:tetratricopeptide (TPR) repeat protein